MLSAVYLRNDGNSLCVPHFAKYVSENGMFCRNTAGFGSHAPPSCFLDDILRNPQIRTGITYDLIRRKLHGFNEVAAYLHIYPVKQWDYVAAPKDVGVISVCHRINPDSNMAQFRFIPHECGVTWRNYTFSHMNAALWHISHCVAPTTSVGAYTQMIFG